ncbi:MAG: glycosyltransferase family 2 protein [Azoarcus sp.]|jgi:GT2 family glycosyltransferase|nr:glycosyltransferase family 2 protein [Azoarcus sp.]
MDIQNKVSVVIVNYCTPELVKTCVQSLRDWQVAGDDQIIVVDNASPDGSFARLRAELCGIKVLDTGHNGGASYGVNIGVKETLEQYLLILNPDTYFIDDTIKLALQVLDESPDIGLIGLDLIYPDGRRQFSARRFYSILDIICRRLPIGRYWPLKGRLDKHMMISSWEDGKPFDADWVMGTGFIVRRDLFQRIGGMDDSYFLYMEDVDLCARVWSSGARVVCVPNARLVHHHQRSSASGPFSWAGRTHLKSLFTFARKYRVPLLVPPDVNTIRRT